MADLKFKTRFVCPFYRTRQHHLQMWTHSKPPKGNWLYFDESQFHIVDLGILTDSTCLFISGFLQKSNRTVIWVFTCRIMLSTATFNSLLSSKYSISPDSFPGMVVWRTWSIVTVHKNILAFFIDARINEERNFPQTWARRQHHYMAGLHTHEVWQKPITGQSLGKGWY